MSARMKGRWREVERLIAELGRWAQDRDDLRAVALVGSYAYRRPRMSSDVDLVLLTSDPARYGAWLGVDSPLQPARLLMIRRWGPVTELRFRRRSGLQLDVGVTTAAWANTDPLDEGTARVVRDGLRVVHDPYRLLAAAREATGTG